MSLSVKDCLTQKKAHLQRKQKDPKILSYVKYVLTVNDDTKNRYIPDMDHKSELHVNMRKKLFQNDIKEMD